MMDDPCDEDDDLDGNDFHGYALYNYGTEPSRYCIVRGDVTGDFIRYMLHEENYTGYKKIFGRRGGATRLCPVGPGKRRKQPARSR